MICRIWHGWTSPANADAYEELLRSEIFRGIAARPGARIRSADSGDANSKSLAGQPNMTKRQSRGSFR